MAQQVYRTCGTHPRKSFLILYIVKCEDSVRQKLEEVLAWPAAL